MNFNKFALSTLLLHATSIEASCPYLEGKKSQKKTRVLQTKPRSGDGGIPDGGFEAVKNDIIDTVLTNSQDFFPADWEELPDGANYGPLMIRLAWHCSGSYRDSDGRGGCDGGRIRFDPELNWPDNANLNNALKLLEPIKEKYGSKLSWGDLIILAGDAAIESMGGPILGFCGGRIDDADGSDSLILGPSDEQEAIAPCQSFSPSRQGECNYVEGSPIGPTTVGLIYVDPAGIKGKEGDPAASAADVRWTFSKMGFNDTETVALVGGGHAFGKAHGACPNPPCGNGIGQNTSTSGFEGKWTTQPTTWTNQYFSNLLNFQWNLTTGPGGHIQWAPINGPDIFMLTADIAMVSEDNYTKLSKKYESDISALEHDFMHAWYKLTSADMGPHSRCIGDNVPPPQLFQHPLPLKTKEGTNYIDVRSKIQEQLESDPSNSASFVHLAYQCASTYRDTDYKGGCNGARIRFPPESEWEDNQGTADTLATLSEVHETFPDVSMSDIIVLAGQTALEHEGFNAMKFCGGRVDAEDAHGSDILAPRRYDDPVISVTDDMAVKGLTHREGVALAARRALSNQFFTDLLAAETTENFTVEELALVSDPELKAIVEEYAGDEDTFHDEFSNAWTKMMVADRFDGPFKNACEGVDDITLASVESTTEQSQSAPSGADRFYVKSVSFVFGLLIVAQAILV